MFAGFDFRLVFLAAGLLVAGLWAIFCGAWSVITRRAELTRFHVLTGRAGQVAGTVGILIGLALLAAAVLCWNMLPE